MKLFSIIFCVVLSIILFSTAHAAPGKFELRGSQQSRKYNEMGHIFVNFFIDLLSTIRKNIENDDEASNGIQRLQLNLFHKLLQFFGKQIVSSDDKIGQTIFNAFNAIVSLVLNAAETKLNQEDTDEFSQESLPIPAIVQTLMHKSLRRGKISTNVASAHY